MKEQKHAPENEFENTQVDQSFLFESNWIELYSMRVISLHDMNSMWAMVRNANAPEEVS